MVLARRLGAEAFGTFWLVLGGCGAAVLTARFDPGGIGILGVALAFGLTVFTMAYAFGHISGGHFNPAVTVGLWIGKRFELRNVLPYIGAQLVGAVAGAGVLYVIASGQKGWDIDVNGFATNGWADKSPGGYNFGAALLTEVVMTMAFLVIILGVTDRRASKGFGPAAIGLGLTLIHLISIPVTNTSVNPARSTGPAIFAGGQALSQLWLFWLAPIVGAAIAALAYRFIMEAPEEEAGEVEKVTVDLDLRQPATAAAAGTAPVTAPASPAEGSDGQDATATGRTTAPSS